MVTGENNASSCFGSLSFLFLPSLTKPGVSVNSRRRTCSIYVDHNNKSIFQFHCCPSHVGYDLQLITLLFLCIFSDSATLAPGLAECCLSCKTFFISQNLSVFFFRCTQQRQSQLKIMDREKKKPHTLSYLFLFFCFVYHNRKSFS